MNYLFQGTLFHRILYFIHLFKTAFKGRKKKGTVNIMRPMSKYFSDLQALNFIFFCSTAHWTNICIEIHCI